MIDSVTTGKIYFMLPILFVVINQILYFEAHTRIKFTVLALLEHSLKTLIQIIKINWVYTRYRSLLCLFRAFFLVLSIICFLLALFTTLIYLELSKSVQHITKYFNVAVIELLKQIFKTCLDQNATN